MSAASVDVTPLLRFLPEERVGRVLGVEPITLGLSGASVYAVTTSRASFVLRVQGSSVDDTFFAQQVRVLRRAAGAGVAPEVLGLADDLCTVAAPTLQDAPSLVGCYQAIRSGAFELHSSRGLASMGLALLPLGVASPGR